MVDKSGFHKFHFLIVVALISLGAWSYGAKLEIISDAAGVIVPISNAAKVQHLEGGIIEKLNVKEGDKVSRGDAIMTLDTTSTDADVEEISGLIAGYKIDKIRLEAELKKNSRLIFYQNLQKKYPELVDKARERLKVRLTGHNDLLAAQREEAKQRSAERKEIFIRIKKNEKNARLLSEQVGISESLLKEKITNRMNHLNLLREQTLVEGKIREDEVALIRLSHAIAEATIRVRTINSNYKETARKELDEKMQALNSLLERHEEKKDSLRRTIIRAPIGGIIQRMYYSTIGGVLSPNAVVADIVPDGKNVKVEAYLPSQDIGYVKVGQSVQVMLSSNDALRFGKLVGKVIMISPDTVKKEGAPPHYKVMVGLEKNSFSGAGNNYQLVPGLQVRCGIIIGERTVMEYVFEPFLNRWKNSLSEP